MQIVYYAANNIEKCEKVMAILERFALSYQIVSDIDLGQTLGYLMKLDGYESNDVAQAITMSDDLLILHDMEDDTIQKLSTALREHDAHIERKAMMTKHNKDWSLLALLQEIKREHAYFLSYDTLKKCIIEASELTKEHYTQESWNPYQQAFLQGYALLQEKEEVAKEKLDKNIDIIQAMKTQLRTK